MKVHLMGGGTFSHVRPHLALAAPAFGNTVVELARILDMKRILGGWQESLHVPFEEAEIQVWLSRMAEGRIKDLGTNWTTGNEVRGGWVTNEDVARDVDALLLDPKTKAIFFSVALCDFNGAIVDGAEVTPSGKDQPRLMTHYGDRTMILSPAEKIIGRIRKERKDIFLVGFKTTTGATPQEQYELGLGLLKRTSCNLVLANDLHTRLNMVVVPELGRYYETTDRRDALLGLVEMASRRQGLTFTRTNMKDGKLLPWKDDKVPVALRNVVDYCINRGAYRPFNNITVGHFGFMAGTTASLWSSRRKRNFNNPEDRDLVAVSFTTEGVFAYGAKPSAGATSQQLVLKRFFPKYDCIVHGHFALKPGSRVAVQSQHDFECGSLECGRNTLEGMTDYGNVAAVMLDHHGPNIIFNRNTDPADVVAFIEENFILDQPTDAFLPTETPP